ncbi:hypothetical protein IV203_028338 [Nitzschia inconspicua]|uniref:Uncharacterized protein n=1 Tax=Nitzschia inconspicua TaxID=303405 RepID=A0A9K3K9B1_9STRA|nr:hypothetical protein IV203_028338 [Nitzschia inconspicua]
MYSNSVSATITSERRTVMGLKMMRHHLSLDAMQMTYVLKYMRKLCIPSEKMQSVLDELEYFGFADADRRKDRLYDGIPDGDFPWSYKYSLGFQHQIVVDDPAKRETHLEYRVLAELLYFGGDWADVDCEGNRPTIHVHFSQLMSSSNDFIFDDLPIDQYLILKLQKKGNDRSDLKGFYEQLRKHGMKCTLEPMMTSATPIPLFKIMISETTADEEGKP